MSLRDCFDRHKGRYVGKIDHFFDVYERYFSAYRGRPVNLLEIGVYRGGSLEIWREYFGPQATIHGIDINPDAINHAPVGSKIHIGSQGDPDFLKSVASAHGPFDIVIDDGSHLMPHQIDTFETLYPLMHERGIYVCEDAFTSYWREYGGQLGGATTFIEHAKRLVDDLHAFWAVDEGVKPTLFTTTTRAVHFYSGTVVFEREPVTEPVYAVRRNENLQKISIADLKRSASENTKQREIHRG
ncbi:MAG: class I SAM-dependent methyltransferase [Halieaceae bacterium]